MTRAKKCSVSSNPSSTSGSDVSSDGGTKRCPGPSGLPIVGSMLEWEGPRTNLTWSRTYGPIYHVRMGNKNLVYLNSLELVNKHLEGRKGELFLDRPMGPAAIGEGLLFGSGQAWEKNKRAFMKALHTNTFLEHMEGSTQSEATLVLENLQLQCGKPIKIGDVLLPACANSITGLLLGGALPRDSPERKELLKIAKSMEGIDLTSLRTKITLKHPKLREPLQKLTFKDIVDMHGTSRRLQRLLRQWIRQSRTGTLAPSQVPYNTIINKTDTTDKSSRKCPRLIIPQVNSVETQSSSGCPHMQSLEMSKLYESEECLMTPPQDDKTIDLAMRNSSYFATFGFAEASRTEIAYETPAEPKEQCPDTPITEFKWTFSRQMSVNPRKDSILQRILNQPEFIHTTEENDTELLQSLLDMFFGGVTSTLSALEFILLHLTQNQLMQKHAQEEIDSVLADIQDGGITWSLREKMPYVRGCITESLRLGSITPSSLPHVAKETTEIEGYVVQKGWFVLASLFSLHYDPIHYLDPEAYRPQRHLDSQGNYQTPKSYRPYGIGARRCVGDKMSEMQLFLYTVHILKNFNLKPLPGKKGCSTETHMRIVHRLKDFKCILERRGVSK